MRQPLPFETGFTVAEDGCWVWDRPLNSSGYGGVFYDGQRMGAHRASYLMHVGPIAEGLQIDHLCRNRACVNPEHLQAVTRAENQKRGVAGWNVRQAQQAKTRCPQGHSYDDDNTLRDKRGWRICKTCRRIARKDAAA